uniref:Uncharacterized protein n=1 Tax=Anguilla anguilla TaxID=7936 RepID=A0A0E9P9L4_ANGAN
MIDLWRAALRSLVYSLLEAIRRHATILNTKYDYCHFRNINTSKTILYPEMGRLCIHSAAISTW